MKTIKVAHIITQLDVGGAQLNTVYTVENLDKTKFETMLIHGKSGELRQQRPLHFHRYTITSLVREFNPYKDIKALLSIYHVLKLEKPDIVHTHSLKAGILGRLAACFAAVPVIVHTVHGWSFNPYQNFFIRSLIILIEKFLAPFTDTLIVVSNADLKKGKELNIVSNYVLIRSGIDLKKFDNIPQQKRQYIVTIGNDKPQKNIAAFGRLARRFPNEIFMAVGPGLDLVNNDNITDFLSQAKLYISTALWEGMPRSVIEALSCHVPVVAYDIDCMSEVVEDFTNGLLVPVNDEEALYKDVKHLLNNPNTLRQLSENTTKFINKTEFDINIMVKKIEKLYLDLMHDITGDEFEDM